MRNLGYELWNPVKELKGTQHRQGESISQVESGEGIERLVRNAFSDFVDGDVESGEGIERWLRSRAGCLCSHVLWNPVKELKDAMAPR
mgnify:CR=1 FL=1